MQRRRYGRDSWGDTIKAGDKVYPPPEISARVLMNNGARGVLFRGIATQRKEIPALDLSDLDGLLVFPSVWAGEYEVEVQGSPSQLPVRRSLKVGRGGNKETLALPTGTLSGTVIGPQGPAAGAVVLAAPQGAIR